jgi:hypothetical protein
VRQKLFGDGKTVANSSGHHPTRAPSGPVTEVRAIDLARSARQVWKDSRHPTASSLEGLAGVVAFDHTCVTDVSVLLREGRANLANSL